MDVCTLASGSKGNCLAVSCGQTHILIDAGISARRITRALGELGLRPQELSAIFITHSHSDHINGLRVLSKQLNCPIFATAKTALDIQSRVPELDFSVLADSMVIGSLSIECFPTPHDAPGSVGYRVTGDGMRFAICTDLGHLTQPVMNAVENVDLLICEANHDVSMLESGPYPPYLQARILGNFGHLSNEAGAELASLAAHNGAQAIVLAHLSQENNTPAIARRTVSQTLEARDYKVQLFVAPAQEPGPVFRLENGRVSALEETVLC